MNTSHLLRHIIAYIGFLVMPFTFAMPPAPPGPYQSIEDDFVQVEPVPGAVQRTNQQPAVAPEQADRNEARVREWGWGAPSKPYLQNRGPGSNPGNQYPPSHPGGNYRYNATGAPR